MADAFDKPWSGVGTGGTLALDFVNTLDWRLRETPEERLHTYPDLARWARTAGVVGAAEARGLRDWAGAHPRLAARTVAGAIEVREAIATVLLGACCGDRVPQDALATVEAACHAGQAALSLRPGPADHPHSAPRLATACPDGESPQPAAVRWAWREPAPEPERPVWAAALDASRILTGDLVRRVRQCCDDECGWMFLDTSRNNRRRWCTMETCGNRNKARRFYRRASSGRTSSGT